MPAITFKPKDILPAAVPNQAICFSPEKASKDHAQKVFLWNLAKKASLVGFFAISGVAFVGVSLFAPQFTIPTLITILVVSNGASDAFSFAQDKESEHTLEKKKNARIAAIKAELDALEPGELAYRFEICGISPRRIKHAVDLQDGIKSLIPGVATLLYYCERVKQIYEERRELLEKIHDNASKEMMRQAFYLERAGMGAQINAAFIFGLLNDPFNSKTLDEIGTIPLVSAEHYALERLYDRSSDVFIFNEKGRSSLRESDFNTLHAPHQLRDLSEQLFNRAY